MTHQLPAGDDPNAPHDPDKWLDDTEVEPDVPNDIPSDEVDEDYLEEGEPGDRTGSASTRG